MRVVKERLRYVVNAYNLIYAGSRWAGELLRAHKAAWELSELQLLADVDAFHSTETEH
jgi:hypothetical protein